MISAHWKKSYECVVRNRLETAMTFVRGKVPRAQTTTSERTEVSHETQRHEQDRSTRHAHRPDAASRGFRQRFAGGHGSGARGDPDGTTEPLGAPQVAAHPAE